MTPVKLSDLIEALEFDCDEFTIHVDLQSGKVVRVDSALLDAVESGSKHVLENVPDWEKEDVAVARAILDDSNGRFMPAPDKFEFHEYRHMERFTRTVEDDNAADQLWRAIKGKGAFRHFKDTADRFNLLERWYQYRDQAMKDFVLEWAGANGVSVADDSPGTAVSAV